MLRCSYCGKEASKCDHCGKPFKEGDQVMCVAVGHFCCDECLMDGIADAVNHGRRNDS